MGFCMGMWFFAKLLSLKVFLVTEFSDFIIFVFVGCKPCQWSVKQYNCHRSHCKTVKVTGIYIWFLQFSLLIFTQNDANARRLRNVCLHSGRARMTQILRHPRRTGGG